MGWSTAHKAAHAKAMAKLKGKKRGKKKIKKKVAKPRKANAGDLIRALKELARAKKDVQKAGDKVKNLIAKYLS